MSEWPNRWMLPLLETRLSNGSGQPASYPGFDSLFSSVLFQTKPKTWPALSWRGLLPGPDRTLRFFGRVLQEAEPHFCELSTLAPIKYLSYDHITIWYIRKWCCFACSSTSYPPLCDPINIRWVAVKWRRKLSVFRCDPTNIDWITNLRTGGGRACNTTSLTHISYCDTIRTQILNWSKSSELAKLRNQPKNRGFVAVLFFGGVKPVAMVPVRFQPEPGTEPRIWNWC